MTEISQIQQNIREYLKERTDLAGASQDVILTAMENDGKITRAEIDALKGFSAFGYGYLKTGNKGISLEHAIEQEEMAPVPYNMSKAELEAYEKARIANEAKMTEIRENLQELYESTWINMFIPSYKVHESGYKIKFGEKEKSIEEFIKDDLKLDILSEEGINTYARLMYADKEELKNVNTDKLASILKDELKMDITQENGREVFLRLLNLGNEIIENIDVKNIADAKKFVASRDLSVEDAADILEEQGVIIRDREEFENTQEAREKRQNKHLITSLMAYMYDTVLTELYEDERERNNLLSPRSSYVENIKDLMRESGFTFDLPSLDAQIDNMHRQKAQMLVLGKEAVNEELFNKRFEEMFGCKYSDEKAAALTKLIDEKGFDLRNKDIQEAVKDLFGMKSTALTDNELRQKNNQLIGGALGVIAMVVTMGVASEGMALKKAAEGFIGAQKALQAGSALGATNAFEQFILKNITTNPMARSVLFGGLNFGVYSAGQSAMSAVIKGKEADWTDLNSIPEAFCSSYLFGAFAAEFGMTAVAKASSKASRAFQMRTMKPIIEKFSKNPVMSGQEFMHTLLKNESKIVKAVGSTAGFLTEVGGFAGYEMLLQGMSGQIPEDMSFGEYLGEVLTSQFQTLGEFKIAGFIINSRFAKGKIPPKTMDMLRNPTLENLEIRPMNNNGKVSYTIKDVTTGKVRTCKNLKEVKARCLELMQAPTKFDKKLKSLKVGESAELDLGEGNRLVCVKVGEDKIETRRELDMDGKTFIIVRDSDGKTRFELKDNTTEGVEKASAPERPVEVREDVADSGKSEPETSAEPKLETEVEAKPETDTKPPKPINTEKLDALLSKGSTIFNRSDYSSGTIGKILADGRFLFKTEDGSYNIETPADNSAGYSQILRYSPDGKLMAKKIFTVNNDGSNTETIRNYDENGKIQKEFITTKVGDKTISEVIKDGDRFESNQNCYKNGEKFVNIRTTNSTRRSDAVSETETYYIQSGVKIVEYELKENTQNTKKNVEINNLRELKSNSTIRLFVDAEGLYFDENGKQVDYNKILSKLGIKETKYDSPEALAVDIPDGCYYDAKTKKIVKVNKDKIKLVREGDEKSGYIGLYDEKNNVIGRLHYTSNNKGELYFDSFTTAVNGLGLGSMIIEEMVKVGKEYGKDITATAKGRTELLGRNKKATNLGFYYKMGFKAVDPGIDKLIQQCLAEGKEIPISLNKHVDIKYVGKNAELGTENKIKQEGKDFPAEAVEELEAIPRQFVDRKQSSERPVEAKPETEGTKKSYESPNTEYDAQLPKELLMLGSDDDVQTLGKMHIITKNKLREKFNSTPELRENAWWQENFEDLLKATERGVYIYGAKRLAAPIIQERANYARKLLLETIMNDKELRDNPIIQEYLAISSDFSRISNVTSIKEAKYTYAMMKKIFADKRLQNIDHVKELILCASKEQYDFRVAIIDRILNDEILSNNQTFMLNFTNIVQFGYSAENKQSKTSCLKILDKITSDERLYKNRNIMDNIYNIISSVNRLESSQEVIEFFDAIINNPELYSNESIVQHLGHLALRKQMDKLRFFNNVYGNEEYKNNKVLMENLGNIAQSISYDSSAESMIKMLEKIYSREEFKNNKSVMDNIDSILKASGSDRSEKSTLKMLDLLFSKDEYKDNTGLMENIHKIVTQSTDEDMYNNMSKMLETLFSKQEYRENKNLMDWAFLIVKGATNEYDLNAKTAILEKIFSKEEYRNCENLMDWTGKIVNDCAREEAAEAKAKMLEVFFSKEEYKNNERLKGEIGRIINSCTEPEDVAAKQKVMDLCLTEKHLTENQNVQECFGYIVTNASGDNKVPEMADKYLKEPLLNANEDVKKYAGYIISGAKNEYMTKILDKYLEEPKLNQNKNVQSMIGFIIVYTNKEEVSKSRLGIIDKYLSTPELFEDESVQNELGNIIKRCTTKRQLKSSIEFIDNYVANKTAFEQKYGAGNFGKILSVYSVDNAQLLEQAVNTPNLNKDRISDILKSSYIEDLGDDAGGNAGHVDETKLQRFMNLLQNPRIAPFVVKLVNDGMDMDTASFLAKTKQGYYQNKQDNSNSYIPKNSNYSASQIEFATELGTNGMKKGEIDALVKFAYKDGKIDSEIRGFSLLLLKNGFPSNMILNEVKDLWDDRMPSKKHHQPQVTEAVVDGRTRESIKGLERKVIEQYQPDEKVWRSEEATKTWAEEKYQAMKSIDYISTRNTEEDPNLADKITRQRAEMLNKWYEFMETDPDTKDNPFARITILKAITEDLLPENSKTAVEFDKTLAKKIIADAMNDADNVSFRKAYSNALKAQSQKGDKGEKIDFDGVRGTMFTVPQTDSSSEDFTSNVAKVKAYSDGTNWCIRSWNAAPYVQQGAMHFFVDEHGMTQVCIRESSPGQVAEIQQRQQNGTRPIPYITAIKDYMDRHGIKYPEHYLDDALAAKPDFDKMKNELQTFVDKKDYKGILEKIGITVTVKPDGTWELSHYKAQLDKFTLNDLGINENDLLANVSSIKGDADFANSNATSIPKLEYVHGQFNFIGSNLSDLRSLKEINGSKITWEEADSPKSIHQKSAQSPKPETAAKWITERLESANSREDFAALRDEIKNMPEGAERQQLIEAYQARYNEWKADPQRPDVRMQYRPESPVQNKYNLVENTPATPDEARAILIEAGLPAGEVDALDLNNKHLLYRVKAFNTLMKLGVLEEELDISSEEDRKQIYDSFLENEEKCLLTLVNEENLNLLKQKGISFRESYKFFDSDNIGDFSAKLDFYEKYKSEEKYSHYFDRLLDDMNEKTAKLFEILDADEIFDEHDIAYIMSSSKDNGKDADAKIEMYKMLRNNKDLTLVNLREIICFVTEDNIKLAKFLIADKDYHVSSEFILNLKTCKSGDADVRIEMYKQLKTDNRLTKNDIDRILLEIHDFNVDLTKTLLADKDFPVDKIDTILVATNPHNIELTKVLCEDKIYSPDEIKAIISFADIDSADAKLEMYRILKADNNYSKDEIKTILQVTRNSNLKFAKIFCKNKEYSLDDMQDIINNTTSSNEEIAMIMCKDKRFTVTKIVHILQIYNDVNAELIKTLYADGNFTGSMIFDICSAYDYIDPLADMNAKMEMYRTLRNGNRKIELEGFVLTSTLADNLELAKVLYAEKDFPQEMISTILRNNKSSEKDIILNAFKSGMLAENPKLKYFEATLWDNIVSRDLLNTGLSISEIEKYAKCQNDNCIEINKKLNQDALANKDLLKSGLEDITDYEINSIMTSGKTLLTCDLIGLGNLEAAFPLMLEEFKEFTNGTAELYEKLSPENLELLRQKLQPETSKAFKAKNSEVTALKKQLNVLVGPENLAKIKELQSKKAELDQKIKDLKELLKVMTPDTEESQKLMSEWQEEVKAMQKQSKTLGSQAQSIYYTGKNAAEIKELMKQISILSKEMRDIINTSSKLYPQEVVKRVRVISALTEISTLEEITEFINMLNESTPENDSAWNRAVNKKIFQKLEVEFDEVLSEKLDLVHCKYLSEMMSSSHSFFVNMKKLVNVIKNNPELSIEEALDQLPQNVKTKEIYKALGIDYEKWTKVDKNSYKTVQVELNAEESRQAAIHNLEEDLNDALFKSLPEEFTKPIFDALRDELGVTLEKSFKDNWEGDGFANGQTEFYKLYKNGKPITFEDMGKIVSIIKKQILSVDFWTTTNRDPAIDNARGTMYTHLIKMRTQEVDNAKDLKDNEISEIEIRKTDMYDVKKAIGLGNDAQCCTALGRHFNEWSAPTYIMNKCIGAIELTVKGNFVGNTMIYLAYVDGEPSLVLDNIELKTKYQHNDKIRDAFIEYAEQLCEDLGCPDMPIYAGPNRHKLDMEIYPKSEHKMEIIGDSGSTGVYVDYDARRHTIGEGEIADIEMYKIR